MASMPASISDDGHHILDVQRSAQKGADFIQLIRPIIRFQWLYIDLTRLFVALFIGKLGSWE
jgi:hypothetical protein